MQLARRCLVGVLRTRGLSSSSVQDSLTTADSTTVTPETPPATPKTITHNFATGQKSLVEFQSESRRLKFEQPGTNRALYATYLKGGYPGWSTHFLPHLDINKWQRKAMFEAKCEEALFQDDPRHSDMEQLGFSRDIHIPEMIRPIKKQRPSDYVLYHDLCEMWKRRQSISLPFISVGSYVEVSMRSQWDLDLPLTFRGIVIEKEHKDLKAFFAIRRNLPSYGYGVENVIPMYSPFLESVKVLSYQVRDDPTGNLQCLRDLTRIQSDIPEKFPAPIFDPESGQEVPNFVPLRTDEYRQKQKQKRFLKSSRHLRPQRMDKVRNYKLWEKDPDERYPRPSVYGKKYRE